MRQAWRRIPMTLIGLSSKFLLAHSFLTAALVYTALFERKPNRMADFSAVLVLMHCATNWLVFRKVG